MIIEKVNQALTAIAEVQKLDPKNWSDERLIDEMNEAYELDDTGLTLFMLLRGFHDQFLEDTSFSAGEILKDPIGFGQRMAEIKKLSELLEDAEVVELIRAFEEKVKANATSYGRAQEEVGKIPEMFRDGVLRRDALRSIQVLEAHQFLQGEAETDHLQLNQYIWEFWNVNSMVRALRDLPVPALSLVLIRDEEEPLHSFFVFGVKNGENVTVLTDRDHRDHPHQGRMSRRPDREMAKRAGLHWFPYHLLGLEPVKGEDIFGQEVVTGYRVRQRKGLVPYDARGFRLAELNKLPVAEFVWLMLVAEEIDRLYGKEHKRLPVLSYTGEMVVQPYALASPEGSLVRRGDYQPIVVKTLTNADVTTESTADQWEQPHTGQNTWMEQRYSSQVPEQILNLVGEKNLLKLGKQLGLTRKAGIFGEDIVTDLSTFDPLVFGTEADLRRDVLWHARYNQMEAISALAKKEFEDTKDEVVKFWKDRILSRREILVEAAASMSFETVTTQFQCDEHGGPCGSDAGKISPWGYIPIDQPVNLVKNLTYDYDWSSRESVWFDFSLGRKPGKRYDEWKALCAVNGKRPTLYAQFKPDNPKALAAVLGLEVKDLPWQMQHWYTHEPYSGNHILRRLDPIDWNVKDPWLTLKFHVIVAFSKSGLAQLRKKLGLPRFDGQIKCNRCHGDGGRHGKPCSACGKKG